MKIALAIKNINVKILSSNALMEYLISYDCYVTGIDNFNGKYK